jgi:hypothetical protein
MFANLFSSSNNTERPRSGEPDGSITGRVSTAVGRLFGNDDRKPAPQAAPAPTPRPAVRQPQPAPALAAKPKTEPQPAPAPQAQAMQDPAAAAPARPAANASLLNGATPPVPSGSFDARWGAIR